MSTPPITYIPKFFDASADGIFRGLQGLDWVRHGDGTVPRMEYYVSKLGLPYTYGKGEFARTYQPQPMSGYIQAVELALGFAPWLDTFRPEVCFLNRYLHQRDWLGWHSDDSPEMDDDRPIVIVSFGVEREIQFRPILSTVVNGNDLEDGPLPFPQARKLKLGHGSICIMHAGMQDKWQHRIPKAGFECGERISLTFRGYKKP